jgi:hypothetical protein
LRNFGFIDSVGFFVRVFGLKDRFNLSADLSIRVYFADWKIRCIPTYFTIDCPPSCTLSSLLLLFLNGSLHFCIILTVLIFFLVILERGIGVHELISFFSFFIGLKEEPSCVFIWLLVFFTLPESQTTSLFTSFLLFPRRKRYIVHLSL